MAMSEAHARFYLSAYNYCIQESQEDGTIVLTFWGINDTQADRLHVKDLHAETEEIIKEEKVDLGMPAHMVSRIQEALALRNTSTEPA